MNTLFLAARCKFWLRASDHSEKSLIPYSNAHSKKNYFICFAWGFSTKISLQVSQSAYFELVVNRLCKQKLCLSGEVTIVTVHFSFK